MKPLLETHDLRSEFAFQSLFCIHLFIVLVHRRKSFIVLDIVLVYLVAKRLRSETVFDGIF